MQNVVVDRIKKYILADGFNIVIDLKKSRGSWLFNTATERPLLDLGYGQFGSLTVGYNHPDLNDPAFVNKMVEASGFRVALSDVYHPYQADFVEALASTFDPSFKHLFFIDGGAPAVENALKVAFDWKTKKNFQNGKVVEADTIIHFKQAFHGRLGYTLSLTNTADPAKYKFFPKFPWPRIHNPKAFFEKGLPVSYDNEDLAKRQIQDAVEALGDRIAALIVEPIQGEGGDNYFSPSFFRFLRDHANTHQYLLIFDEIQTGWSTGGWWVSGRELVGGVLPDIIVFSKKTQQAGIAVTDRIDDVENNAFKESSRINSTWGGNLPDMVRATKFIEVIRQQGLHDNVSKRGSEIMSQLAFVNGVTNLRGAGGWIAFTLPSASMRDAVWKEAYQNDCLVLKSGSASIRLRPNMALTKEEVETGVNMLTRAIYKVVRELG